MASKRLRDKLELARWDLLNEIAINLSLAREIRSGMWVGTEARTEEAREKEAQTHLRFVRRAKRRFNAVDHAWGMARAGKTDRQIWAFFATTSEMGYYEAASLTRHASSARERMENAYAYEAAMADRLCLTRGICKPPRTPRYVLRCLRAERITNRAEVKVDLAELAYDRHERQHAFAEEETWDLLNR